MLSSGSWTAPSACLRCQLRQVLVGLRPRHPAVLQGSRQLSTTASLQQDDAAATAQLDRQRPPRRDERSYVYRHIHPNGRIIGKPGRRQRQSFEQLATKSLGKPSEVIVLHDVVEEARPAKQLAHQQGGRGRGIAALSVEDMEAAVPAHEEGEVGRGEQYEVNTSIDALRPEMSVLEQRDFNSLVQQLLDGYNVRQLARYLVQSSTHAPAHTAVAQSKLDKDHVQIHVTAWQAGRTPLEQRIGRVASTKGDVGKASLAQQIMRNAWAISIGTEEQRLGEVELYLQPWQVKMMFDLNFEDKPAISTFIDSPLLLRASDVQPYRPDNVLRITARRQDAGEIARQLQVKFASVHRLDMDLNVFKPLLGRYGRPMILELLFRDDDIKYVSDRTGSVIEVEAGGKLAIYTLQDHEYHRFQARRLLLSLLDLPSPHDTRTIVPSDNSTGAGRQRALRTYPGSEDALSLTAFPAQDLHRRYQGKELVRLTAPANKPAASTETRQAAAQIPLEHSVMGAPGEAKRFGRLVGVLDTIPPPAVTSDDRRAHEASDSPWRLSRRGSSSPWRAEFCVLLRTSAETSTPAARTLEDLTVAAHSLVPLHQQPGLAQLLSYFKPLQRPASVATTALGGDRLSDSPAPERTAPYLVAHFLPAPFTKQGVNVLKTLPRIAITFRFDPQTQKLQLFDVKAALKRQAMQLPFPGQAVDVAFTRASTIYLNLDPKKRYRYPALDDFTDRLQTSIQHGSGTLDAMAELDIKLPWWVMRRSAAHKPETQPKEDTAVAYLLDRLEQVQTMDFVPDNDGGQTPREPVDPEMRMLLEQWPEGMFLRLREVDGGVSGGRRTELSLIDGGKRSTSDSISATHSGRVDAPKSAADGGSSETAAAAAAAAGHDDRKRAKGTEPGTSKAASTSAAHLSLPLTTTALRLLRMLTRANAGQLPMLTYDYDGSGSTSSLLSGATKRAR
ncbi:hypothetical protein LTR36_008024 [Oleoguttula mirabilis]|uniref:Uncharacterized protein n=1 Tax=Oleoguttula mirabilis TaxID=1507867 RepID=A0AAV9J8Y1_9PEZI|nr:hypothetical protein LTR36_008024 [Oleoguttula mirabilis]